MSGSDLRGFKYAFGSLLQRRKWEVEASQAKLGQLTTQISAVEKSIQDSEALHVAQANALAERTSKALDPANHAQSMHWLANMLASITSMRVELQGLLAERDDVLARLRTQQREVEAFEADRAVRVADYVRESQARQATVADADWLARRFVLAQAFAKDEK